jgi:serine O-acetyltransferase
MLKALSKEVESFFERDPAAKSKIEIFLFYPGFHAVILHRAAHYLWKKDFRLIAKFIATFSRFITGIEIHPGATIGQNLFIDHGMGVVIGETAVIGDNVTLYHGVTLGGVSPQDNKKSDIRHPHLCDNVIVGSGAQILGAVTIGQGAKIGSNAVVVTNVDEDSIMVGVPARKIEKKAKVKNEKFKAYATEGIDKDPRQIQIEELIAQVSKLNSRVKELEGQNNFAEDTAVKWTSKKKKK